MSRKMADRVSIVAVSIAAFLTTINQISIIITAKQLWMQQQQLQQQLESETFPWDRCNRADGERGIYRMPSGEGGD